MTRSSHCLAVVLALVAIPQAAFAQSMDVRTITRTVADDVCAPFIQSGDIAAARQAAEALGYRLTDGGVVGGFEMEKPHGGRLILSLQPSGGLCSISMAEAAVREIEEAAAPTMRRLGLRWGRNTDDGAGASVVWWGSRVQALAAPSLLDKPGSALTFRFTPPHRGDGG